MEAKDEQRREIISQFQKALEEIKDDKIIFQKLFEYFNEESKEETEKREEQNRSFFYNFLPFGEETTDKPQKPQEQNQTFFQQLFLPFTDKETIKKVEKKPEEENSGLFGNLFSSFAEELTTKKPKEKENTPEQPDLSILDKVYSNFMKKKTENKIKEKNLFQKFILQFVEDTTIKPDKEEEEKKVLFQEFMKHFIEETKNKRKRENLSLNDEFFSMLYEEESKKSDEIKESKTLNFDLNKIENFLSAIHKNFTEISEKITTEKSLETTTKARQISSTTKKSTLTKKSPKEKSVKTVYVTRNQTINIFPYTSEKPPSIIEKVFVMDKPPASENPMIFLIESSKTPDSTSPKAKKKDGPMRKLIKFTHKVILGIVLLTTTIFLLRFFHALLALTQWLLQFKYFLSNSAETYLYLKDHEFGAHDLTHEQYVITTNDLDLLPYNKKWEWEDKTQKVSSIDNSVDDPWILED